MGTGEKRAPGLRHARSAWLIASPHLLALVPTPTPILGQGQGDAKFNCKIDLNSKGMSDMIF